MQFSRVTLIAISETHVLLFCESTINLGLLNNIKQQKYYRPQVTVMNGIFVALLFSFLTVFPAPSYSNGWEHLAIPRETLLAALDSGNPHVMEHAVISIGVRRESRDVAPLLSALEKATNSESLRAEIYRALGLIGDSSGVSTLIVAFKKEEHAEIRATIAISLGAIGDPAAIPILIQSLNTEDRIVRLRIIDALGAFSEPDTIAVLTKLAEPQSDKEIRLRALRSLGATGSKSVTGVLLEALRQAKDNSTKAIIIDGLTNVAPEAAFAPLSELLGQTDNPFLQVKIAVALGAIAGDDQVSTLSSMLFNENYAVQSVAVKSLTDLKIPESLPAILQLYEKLAIRRPKSLNFIEANDKLAYLADLDLMLLLVRAILEIKPEDGVLQLLDAAQPRTFNLGSSVGVKLGYKVYELRRLAIYSLGYTGSQDVFEFLRPIPTNEADYRIRSVAMRSLGVLGFPDSYQIAVNRLTDIHPEVRWNAAVVLGRLKQPKAVPVLLKAAQDPHAQVRLNVIESLGLLGNSHIANRLLFMAAEDKSRKVREAAQQAASLVLSRHDHEHSHPD